MIVAFPLEIIPVPTVLSRFLITIVPLAIGVPVILSVALTFIVTLPAVVLLTCESNKLSLLIISVSIVLELASYVLFPGYSTIITSFPRDKLSFTLVIPVLFMFLVISV